ARLELASGCLRYVDAGHGYCLLRRAGGDLERLPTRSLPVGIGQAFAEGAVCLRPGDTLLVCSDGLVELEAGTVPLEDLASELDPGLGAGPVVDRLVATVHGRPADDVAVLVLTRAGSSAAAVRVAGRRPASAPPKP